MLTPRQYVKLIYSMFGKYVRGISSNIWPVIEFKPVKSKHLKWEQPKATKVKPSSLISQHHGMYSSSKTGKLVKFKKKV